MNPVVVVLAYERPAALGRLLRSLSAAHYADGVEVTLVISVDRGAGAGWNETLAVARAFDWPHGPKSVIERNEHLGVVGQFREAGRLTRSYEAIVLLEDDLVVSPYYYDFAAAVLDAYAGDDSVAGCCLYGLWFNGFTREPFLPVEDGSDVFFLRLPYTQGLCFSRAQWLAFDDWWQPGARRDMSGLHPSFQRFGPDEWFPALAAYLAARERYFCFPRVSLTVGWGDAGAHFARASAWFQTPVQLGPRRYQLPAFDEALSVYDGFFELLPSRLRALAPHLDGLSFDVDLNATKRRRDLTEGLVLTTRPVKAAVARYGLDACPPELNVVWQVAGSGVSLARVEDVRWDRLAEAEARRRLHAYAWRHYRPSRRRALWFALARRVEEWRRRRSKAG